jgi:hypothetical protein
MGKTILLCAALAVSIALNVRQYDRASRLSLALEDAENTEPLSPGAKVPAMTGLALDGSPHTIVSDRASRRQIVYWTSASCRWSARNRSRFDHLWRTQRDRYDIKVVAATPEDLPLLAKSAEASYILSGPPSQTARRDARLRATPTTLVLDERGTVLRQWRGAYFGAVQQEIETFFGVTLPPEAETRPITTAAR